VILDRANEEITAYPVVLVDDGYGGQKPAPGPTPTTFRAFATPVGFSGAGWAINSKLQSQGFADVNRVRLLFKPINGGVPLDRWSHLEFQGQEWTVQEEPRLIKGLHRRQDHVTVTVELKGAA
jgi:hypothetical protein